MANISKINSLSIQYKQSDKLMMLLLILLAICVISQPAEAETSIYVFDTDQSIVVRSGGIAGLQKTFSIAGRFQLTIDSVSSVASFEIVDANLTDEAGSVYGQSLDEIFNMTGLTGIVVDDKTIEFEGKTADGTESNVSLTLTLSDNLAHITGKTTPPPNSADMFFYDIDAVAVKKYAGGTGEPNDPYQIATTEDLMLLGDSPEDYDKHFILTADIDLDPNLPGCKIFDEAVIAPDANYIDSGFQGISFTGIFDGKGHTISHLTVAGESHLGLFGHVSGYNAKIKDLGLVNPKIDASTGGPSGSLVGYNEGSITNCYVEGGIVSGQGGLVGGNYGTITCCFFTGSVSGITCVGGLVGWNGWLYGPGIISDCYSTGSVSGDKTVGGLVGYNESAITNCYAASTVLGNQQVGGLVGYNDEMISLVNKITNCYFLAPSDGGGPDNGQGLPLTEEQMKKPASFIDWDFVGKPDGPHDIWAEPVNGGYPILWWQLSPLPELPFSGGTGQPDDPYLISTSDELNSIGHNPRLMEAHFRLVNDIDLTGVDFFIIGSEIYPFTAVFDGNDHSISNLNHTSTDMDGIGLFGNVKGPMVEIRDLGLISPNINSGNRCANVGSLVGYFEGGTISNCYAEGGSVTGFYNVGGLIGWIDGSITNCHSSSIVSGINDVGGLVGLVGGLVGSNKYTGTISNCYSTGRISGDRPVGGLVGANLFGHMTNCYATVAIAGNESVGGLVGLNWNVIENCYSTGNVSGSETVGGLVGTNDPWGTVVNSFWDIETTGQTTSAGGEGKTTAEMQTAATFLKAGWDFVDETANGTEDIWWILEGQDYPRLWWETSDL